MLKPGTYSYIYGSFPLSLISLGVLIFSHLYGTTGLLCSILLLMIPLCILRRHIDILTACTCALGLILGTMLNLLNTQQTKEDQLFIGHSEKTNILYATALQDSSYHGQKHGVWMRLSESEGRYIRARAKGKIRLYIPSGQPRFFRGARLALTIRPANLNDPNSWIAVKKVSVSGYSHSIWALRARIFEKTGSLFEQRFDLRSGLFFALILGDRSALLPIPAHQIRLAGITHLLALSGLHLGLLTVLLFSVFHGLTNKKNTYLIVLPVLLSYVILVGCPSSLIRAYLSVALAACLWIRGRNARSLDILGFVCLLSLLIDPTAFLSLSWQLSFLSVLGILLFQKDYAQLLHFLPRPLAEGLAVGLAATTATTPILSWRFSEAYPHGILATIVVMPFLFFWMISGILTMLFAVLRPVFVFFDEAVWWVIRLFSWMPSWSNFSALITFTLLIPFFCYLILWRKNNCA